MVSFPSSVAVFLRRWRHPVLPLVGGVLLTVSGWVMSGHAAEVHLSWQDNSDNETGFAIERATDPGDFQKFAEVGADVTAFVDDTVAPSVTYHYRVRAYNSAGHSAYSNVASVGPIAPEPNTPPTIGAIPDHSILAGSMTRVMSFAVSDSQTDASSLKVTAHSSNPASVPDANLFLGGYGSTRMIAVSTVAHQAATATITVIVSDGELSARTTFILQVHDIGDAIAGPGNSLRGVPLASAHEGIFTVEFSATPPVLANEAIIGLSQGAAAQSADLAAVVRFNDAGWIDALDGASYRTVTPIPFARGLAYRVRMVVNPTTHTYSVFVTPPRGSELTVGVDFRFGAGQETVSRLDTWNVRGDGNVGDGISVVTSVQTSAGGAAAPDEAGMKFNDLGAPGVPGFGIASGSRLVLRSGTANVDHRFDHFRFGYQRVWSDAELTVHVDRLVSLGSGAMAGLMFRSSLAPLSAYVGVFVTKANGLVLQWRRVDGGDLEVAPPFPGSAPQWLRLIRVADLFYAMGSADGENWDLIEFTGVELPETVLGGIAVGAQDSPGAKVAIFSGFAVD